MVTTALPSRTLRTFTKQLNHSVRARCRNSKRFTGSGMTTKSASTVGFHTEPRILAAQSFTMPAMSPTMTEGNIASWKVKEGDTFSTGDVLLEIETDKAQMDVEAQDDGVVAKITMPNGSKGVKVGSRIAVLADLEDDLSSLSIPPDVSTPTTNSEGQSKSKPSNPVPPQPKAEPNPSLEKGPTALSDPPRQSPSPTKQSYPLYPSVAQLLHQRGIPMSEAGNIPASGPKGRLLKGDVLAYLGAINASYSSEQSARIANLSRLDFSSMKIVPSTKNSDTSLQPTGLTSPMEKEPDTEVAVSISFRAVREVQDRIHNVLGIDIPTEEFVARAVELSNLKLPRSNETLTSDELFAQILGLDNVLSSTSRGSFTPQVSALPPSIPPIQKQPKRNTNIIDILTNKKPISVPLHTKASLRSHPTLLTGNSTMNVFSLTVPKAEQQRAKVFLERVKTVLHVNPGRLVLQ